MFVAAAAGAGAGTIPVVAIISLIVAPLYGLCGWILIRVGRLQSDTEQIPDNEERVEQVEDRLYTTHRYLAEIERDLQKVQNNQEVVHDLVAEENHCGVDGCPWCVVHDPGGHDDSDA